MSNNKKHSATDSVISNEKDASGSTYAVPIPDDEMMVDQTDVNIFGRKPTAPKPAPREKLVQIVNFDPLSEYYDMTNLVRGNALIFNHMNFDKMNQRKGTEIDGERIHKNLEKLNFKVSRYNDLERDKMLNVLDKASEEDYTHHDCLVIVVMTHGDVGVLWAKDKSYKVSELWEPFTGINCKSLIGKPKLIFIQACRGDELDHGVQIKARSFDFVDSLPKTDVVYSIPSMADLLVMYSTFEGHYSWRNPSQGSWFIQALCDELDENGQIKDLLTLLTAVSRRVAYGYQSNVPQDYRMDAKKQIPSIVSMLTRTLFFTKKLSDLTDSK